MDILFELFRLHPGQGILWPPFMHILLKRLLDSNLISVQEPTGFISTGGLRMTPDTIFITSNGSQFVYDLGLHEF